jgi:hypothetical protein
LIEIKRGLHNQAMAIIQATQMGGNMLRSIAAAALCSVCLGAGPAPAADDCSPHCDYWHYYGPYDFSYISPGLVAYPRCDRQGDCSPHLIYVYPNHRYGRITIRPLGRPKS